MALDRCDDYSQLYPGQWVATSQGHVIAHGLSFHEVAAEACTKAFDISFDLVPDLAPPAPRPEAGLQRRRNARLLAAQETLLPGPESRLSKS